LELQSPFDVSHLINPKSPFHPRDFPKARESHHRCQAKKNIL